jgi:hypothetical protein
MGGRQLEKIDRAKLEAILTDLHVPEGDIRPYLQIDPAESQAFRPSIVANPARVAYPDTEAAVALASLNGVSRWRRQTLYRSKIGKGWSGLKVVAEGDSWFQYPFLIEDVIDHLFDPWAILCLSGAGDLLGDMAKQDEVTVAVAAERPDVLLLSGGGNDILGGGQLVRHIKTFESGRKPADYVKGDFDDLLAQTVETYGGIIDKALQAGAKRVVLHTYDYVIPNNGPWLGRPLLKLGIADRALQRAILRVLIDRFHAALSRLSSRYDGKVALVDVRGTVGDDEWYDELHPTTRGFAKVARLIRAAAEGGAAEGAELESVSSPEFPEAVERPLPVADAEAVMALLAVESEALVAEIGRRSAILEFSPDAAASYSLELPTATTEGFGSSFMELGARLVDRLHRELYGLLCGDGGEASEERDKLKDALKLSQAAMIGGISAALIAIGTPPFIAPLVAAVIVKSGIDPTWEVTCKFWGEKLGDSIPMQ